MNILSDLFGGLTEAADRIWFDGAVKGYIAGVVTMVVVWLAAGRRQ